jgi:hypothetical protein
MDLVDDDGAHRAKHPAAPVAGEQDVEGFRGRHQDVRRLSRRRGARFLRGIAGANVNAYLGQARIEGADRRKGLLEVFLDVARQRLERRDVEHLGAVLQSGALRQEPIDGRQKCGQRFAGSGGRGDERVLALADVRPALPLRRARLTERGREPGLDGGMKAAEGGVHHASAPPSRGDVCSLLPTGRLGNGAQEGNTLKKE